MGARATRRVELDHVSGLVQRDPAQEGRGRRRAPRGRLHVSADEQQPRRAGRGRTAPGRTGRAPAWPRSRRRPRPRCRRRRRRPRARWPPSGPGSLSSAAAVPRAAPRRRRAWRARSRPIRGGRRARRRWALGHRRPACAPLRRSTRTRADLSIPYGSRPVRRSPSRCPTRARSRREPVRHHLCGALAPSQTSVEPAPRSPARAARAGPSSRVPSISSSSAAATS